MSDDSTVSSTSVSSESGGSASSSSGSSSSSSSSSSSPSSSSSSSCSSSSSSSSSTSSSKCCHYVHLDKAWCPGTKKLREVAREIADENTCPKYSKKIYKKILKRMEGLDFVRSIKKNETDSSDDDSDSDSKDSSDSDSDSDSSNSDSDSDENDKDCEYGFGCYTEGDDVDIDDEYDVEEIEPEDLYEVLRPFYDGELYMIQNEAHCRDVYFKHPNHPGTQAFVRASQYLVARLGVTRDYDERIYQKLLKLLYDSKFFIGTAPECVQADEDECDRIFRARYQFDRRMMRKLIIKRRPIPGTVWCWCCNRKIREKDNCIIRLLGCFPKTLGAPILVVVSIFAFGWLYFCVWYIFKTIITAIYVILGVSVSFLIGGGGNEDAEAIEEVVENVQRHLRGF